MSPGFTPDFPRAGTDAHQMMLDEFDGALRFRMRLYNSFLFGDARALERPSEDADWIATPQARLD